MPHTRAEAAFLHGRAAEESCASSERERLRLKNFSIQVHIRQILLFVLLLAFVVLLVTSYTGLTQLIAVFSSADWEWVLIAILTHAVYFVVYALMYHLTFIVVGVESPVSRLLPIFFASLFVNTVAPLGGLGGAALFVDDAARHGQSGVRAAMGTLLVLIIDLATAVPFVLAAIPYLVEAQEIQAYLVIGSLMFLAYVLLLIAIMVISYERVDLSQRALGAIGRLVNVVGSWFHHPQVMTEKWAEQSALEFVQASRAATKAPGSMFVLLALGVALHAINAAGLYTLFLAYHEPPVLGLVNAAFAMNIVFYVISAIQGVGIVEAVVTLMLVAAGMPVAQAFALAVSYRGLNFWMPLLLGLFFLRSVKTFDPEG